MTTETDHDQLTALIQGELSTAEARALRARLQGDPELRDEKAGLEAVFDLMSIVSEPEQSSEEAFMAGLAPRLAEARARRAARPSIHGAPAVRQAGWAERLRRAPLLAASVLIHIGAVAFLTAALFRQTEPSIHSAAQLQMGWEEAEEHLPLNDPLTMENAVPDSEGGVADPVDPPVPGPNPHKWELRRPEPVAKAAPSPRQQRRAAFARSEAGAPVATAVGRGLDFLARAQRQDGSWGDLAQTAAVSIAFLGEGRAVGSERPDHRIPATLWRGLAALRAQRHISGWYGEPKGDYLTGHALALQALAENHRLAGRWDGGADRVALRSAARLLVQAQQSSGAWATSADPFAQPSPEATFRAVLALRTIAALELQIPEIHLTQAIAGAQTWLARHAVTSDDALRAALAAAVTGDAPSDAQLATAREHIGSPAAYALSAPLLTDDSAWTQAMHKALLATQRGGVGPQAGGWTDVHSTALALQALQAAYR